jgi:hypothetical protein
VATSERLIQLNDVGHVSGTHELLNVFGEPTGIRVSITHGHPMPHAPHGQTWRLAEEGETEC